MFLKKYRIAFICILFLINTLDGNVILVLTKALLTSPLTKIQFEFIKVIFFETLPHKIKLYIRNQCVYVLVTDKQLESCLSKLQHANLCMDLNPRYQDTTIGMEIAVKNIESTRMRILGLIEICIKLLQTTHNSASLRWQYVNVPIAQNKI